MGRLRPHRRLPWTALLALIAGITLYLLSRDPASAHFTAWLPSALFPDTPLTCRICGSLPSLLHVYAFILFSATVLQPASTKQLAWLCLSWWGIESLFEVGQIDAVAVSIHQQLPEWTEQLPLLGIMDDYLLHGTFDPLDLLFAGLGTLAAFGLLVGRLPAEVRHDQAKEPRQLPV